MALNLSPNLGDHTDPVYAALIAAQADLSDEAAADWLARLVLILCNHVGDAEVLQQAFHLARQTARQP